MFARYSLLWLGRSRVRKHTVIVLNWSTLTIQGHNPKKNTKSHRQGVGKYVFLPSTTTTFFHVLNLAVLSWGGWRWYIVHSSISMLFFFIFFRVINNIIWKSRTPYLAPVVAIVSSAFRLHSALLLLENIERRRFADGGCCSRVFRCSCVCDGRSACRGGE